MDSLPIRRDLTPAYVISIAVVLVMISVTAVGIVFWRTPRVDTAPISAR